MHLRVLGCGSSAGVPSILGDWQACDPSNPKNRRTRTSLAIASQEETWLIDAGPDLKVQLLREGIQQVHGVFLTHAHADHVLGLNEIKPMAYVHGQNIPLYGDEVTLDVVRQAFGYLIDDGQGDTCPAFYKPFFQPHTLQPSFTWQGQTVKTFMQHHGAIESVGYHFGTWAYSTDVKHLSEEALTLLKGVRLWFVGCLDTKARVGHADLAQVLSWISYIKPELAVLIHMSSFLDYEALKNQLPAGVVPAYDGMQIDVRRFM